MEVQSSHSTRTKKVPLRYTLIEMIGQGNYGNVWKATDNTSGTTVAVKEIHKNATLWRRFHKELKYGKMLGEHTNIVTTHDMLYETRSSYFIAQDLALGGDLCSLITSQDRIKETRARRYFYQICKAVQHMHSLKLVHLDIKPDNILLKDCAGTSVVLIDFGMTEHIGKKLKRACGSVPYMAPETFDFQGLPARGLTVKPSLDMWSLGVLLFCMLTGSFPWMQAMVSDHDYLEFCRWQAGLSLSLSPKEWCELTPLLCCLLKELLAVDPKCRCKIQDVFGHLDSAEL